MWTLSSTRRIPSRFHGRREAECSSQPEVLPPTYSSRRSLEGLGKCDVAKKDYFTQLLPPDAAAGLPEGGFRGSTVATSRATRIFSYPSRALVNTDPKRPDPWGQQYQLRQCFLRDCSSLTIAARKSAPMTFITECFRVSDAMDIISPGGPPSGSWREQLNRSSVVCDVERHLTSLLITHS